MKMIIGGAYQGQLAWAKEHFPEISEEEWMDGKECKETDIFICKGIYNFHEYIRNIDADKRGNLASELTARNSEIILVSDEIGYGLVPIDAADRCYREQVGRICTELAAFSDEVVRVVMGIGTKIKE